MTHQNGYTMANLSARKQFDEGTIRTIGANFRGPSPAIPGMTKPSAAARMPSSIPATPAAR
jgi:hypothetical protein